MIEYNNSNRLVPKMPRLSKVSEWIEELHDAKSKLTDQLHEIYGDDEKIIDARKNIIFKALVHFGNIYGTDREVVITRSPCRINLRGMHSEMQHATPNYLTHAREMVIVAGKRNDDRVILNNVESDKFGSREFSISEEMNCEQWGNWTEYIDSHKVRRYIESHRGDWENYVRASVLKIQDEFKNEKLKGMDIVAYGDVPRGNGMSSSSTLVVSSGLAFMAINGLSIDPRELTVCFGRAEWYVGTRGGFGDHGSMLFGKKDHILHSVFLNVDEMNPEYIPIPEGYQVAIINSYRTSTKSTDQLFAYNQTMFAYSMAMSLVKDTLKEMGEYPESFLNNINYLGQITPEIFGLEKIYQMLRNLPEQISISDLKARYSEAEVNKKLDRFFGQLGKYPDHVDVRGPALWGIAESERSREFAKLIKIGKVEEAGKLMFIGHDGDRIWSFDGNYEPVEFLNNRVTDSYLDNLIANLKSNDPKKISDANLAKQPGDYNASSLELDSIVDIASKTDGVIGASLTGAGFGGNVLAIVSKNDDTISKLKKALLQDYYERNEEYELKWFMGDKDLKLAFENNKEFKEAQERVYDIFKRKRITKSGMREDDIAFIETLRRKINNLFKEKKIDREMMFIPANYYEEGVVVNIPVECAEVI